MIELAGYLSAAFYAASAGIFIAAAVVLKKNGLVEYYLLMKGLSSTVLTNKLRKKSEAPAPDVQDGKKKKAERTEDDAATVKLTQDMDGVEDTTNVQDGSSDTSLLRASDLSGKESREKTNDRKWGNPSKRFKVVKSELTYTYETEEKGERK